MNTRSILALVTALTGGSLLAAACSDSGDPTGATGSSSQSTTGVGGLGGAGGGGGAGGIGQPSDVYPAPHGPVPQGVDSGGPKLASPKVVPVVFQGDDAARVTTIADLLTKTGPSDYWKAVTSEYGIGALAVAPVVAVPEQPAATISPSQIETWLLTKLNDPADTTLPAPVDGAIYTLFYPKGVSIADGGGTSCTDFGGYHSSVTLDAAHGMKNVAYAVIPACQSFFGLNAIDALTSTTTHELIEAVTDPFPAVTPGYLNIDEAHAYWPKVYGGGELSDMCNLPLDAQVLLPGTTYQVQRSWSNAAALAGHDPCVPTLPGMVYFNASPDLPDDVAVSAQLTTKGIRIAAGGSRTVDVHLFSEAPTGPIKVITEDWSSLLGGSKQLDLHLDQSSGLNGQTLHLTIDVLGASKLQLFRLSATDGKQWTYWIGAVSR